MTPDTPPVPQAVPGRAHGVTPVPEVRGVAMVDRADAVQMSLVWVSGRPHTTGEHDALIY